MYPVYGEGSDLYDIALRVTDDVMGDGTYAELNGGSPDPGVQAAIARWKAKVDDVR